MSTSHSKPDSKPAAPATTRPEHTMSPEKSSEISGEMQPSAQDHPIDNQQDTHAELMIAQAKVQENYDLYLRALAEADNIRRRAADDVSKAHKFAIESFAEALVPVKDSLERALDVPNLTLESLSEGLQVILRQLCGAFEKAKLQEINPVGEKFDPHKHQAVSMVPGDSVSPAVPGNHVVTVMQKGYSLADRVLRPALVAVAQ